MLPKKEREEVNILVVDDNPDARSLLEEILRNEGFSFDVATSGKEAFRKAMEKKYRLILMDMQMPGWDGLTAIRSLNLVEEYQKIIVISAFLDKKVLKDLEQEPLVIGWMEKPVDYPQLVAMIRKHLDAAE